MTSILTNNTHRESLTPEAMIRYIDNLSTTHYITLICIVVIFIDQDEVKCAEPSIRRLLVEILRSKKSVILHNGLVDLVFLYQNFYAELPVKFQAFLADIQEMFAGGVFDTKYLSEFKLRLKASFLEYAFKKMQVNIHLNVSM